MGKAQAQASNTPIYFPCCKSHLKSQTYFTLVRILSQCANHPQLCGTARAGDPREPIPDNSSNELGDASEKESRKNNDHGSVPSQCDLYTCETVKANGIQDEGLAISIQDEGFSDTHTVISEIENIMNTEEDDGLCKQNNLTVNTCTNGTGMEDEEDFGDLQQLLMNELENLIEGNDEVARETNYYMSTGGDQCVGVGDGLTLSESQRHVDLQSIAMAECSNDGQLQVKKEHLCQYTTCDVSTLSGNNKDVVSFIGNNEVGSCVATQEKEMDFGKPAHTGAADIFSNHTTEGNETEEGEISGYFEVGGKSVMACEDAVILQEQKKHLSENVDGNKFSSNDREEENRKEFGEASTREKAEANDVKKEMVCKRKIVVYDEDLILAEETDRHKRQKKEWETRGPRKANENKGKKKGNASGQIIRPTNSVSSIQNSDQTTTGDKRMKTKDKQMQDAVVCNEKKRGPLPEGRKAKKKERDRKRRAQKNRELGVKRLKLRPVQNPKPIMFCRHYMNGRCHEGEKCKFSHDTVPLTKSKPCGHFARNSCLKGDDCPFDHELSKYPCSNYTSTGSCSRGETCLFSHRLPPKEDLPSAPNITTPNSKATSLPGSKQLNSSGTPGKNTVQYMAKSVLSPVLPPKGISFLSAGKPSIPNSSPYTPSSSSLTKNGSYKDGNTTNQSTTEKTQNSNDTPKGRLPSLAPKGINFLSFGKPNNFHLRIQTSPAMGHAIQVGEDTTQGATSWLNKMLQKTKGMPAQTKSNLSSNVESSKDGIQCKTQSSSSVNRFIQANKISPSIDQELQANSIGSSQSANTLARSWLKDAPNSAQKAFMSTLAFAAKVESEMKMKHSASDALWQ